MVNNAKKALKIYGKECVCAVQYVIKATRNFIMRKGERKTGGDTIEMMVTLLLCRINN